MSIYWNRRVVALSPYIPGEQPLDKTLIKLNTNENPYPPSPRVIEAIHRAAGDELRRYPDPACTEVRMAVAERYGVTPEQVFVGNGSDEVLAFAFAACFESSCHQARPILFPDITYSFYPVYAQFWDIPFTPVPVVEDFSITIEDYKQPSGGVVIPNPNAPTGRALSRTALASLVRYYEQTQEGRVVLVDEAYAAFGRDLEMASLTREHPNLLTVHTLSKAASLAGLRVGFAIGNPGLIQGLCRVRDSFNSYPVDRLAQAGAAAALKDAAYYEAVNQKVVATRSRVAQALQDRGYEVLPSQANFLMIRSPSQGGLEFFTYLRDRGILVRHFKGPRITDFLRVSIGTDAEMTRFLTHLPPPTDTCRGGEFPDGP
ncbi:MAG: histidinol-phosphate transaminase [Spirochaetaceae bacterium]|jgi:histidinol-phosphate aminotransferase|nr:histidinol-phosphate transaminase [Spirochaetaceae bacterium]